MSHSSRSPARYDSEVGKHRSSKNTRRWCKGVVGRDHKPECVPYPVASTAPCSVMYWRNYQCAVCGKVIKRYWPFVTWTADGTMIPSREPKPEWVTK